MINNLANWLKLDDSTKTEIFNQTSNTVGLPPAAVEKDWWVVLTLDIIFATENANHLVFKGGTSLSKAWNIIKRFSEDIDLAINSEFLGFEGNPTKKKITRLRQTSCEFITKKLQPELKSLLVSNGYNDLAINVIDYAGNDTDPIKIEVVYKSLTGSNPYLKPRVLIEIGSRSLIEPFTNRQLSSFVTENYAGRNFALNPIDIPVVNPERTLLEKIFLLHEEFQKPADLINVGRMSRHHYDIIKLMNSEFASIAFTDAELFNSIVNHRSTINKLKHVDYSKHSIGSLNIIPPDEILKAWEDDFNAMSQSMIYDSDISFEQLLVSIKAINNVINKFPFNPGELK